jgi:CHAT domain-containing protein
MFRRTTVTHCILRGKASAVFLLSLFVLPAMVFGATMQPQLLVEQGQRAFQEGNFGDAAIQWQRAVEVFQKQGNTNAAIQTSVSLAAALQSAGQQRSAVEILTNAFSQAQDTHDRSCITLVESKLGAALILTSETERARVLLQEALERAKVDGNEPLLATILNDLGNALASEQKYPEALKVYEESSDLGKQTGNSLLRVQALCNAARAAAKAGQMDKAEQLNTTALADTDLLPASHDKAFLLLTSGRADLQIQSTNAELSRRVTLRAQQSFERAEAIASTNKDLAIETYALGYLGQMYEHDGQSEAALNFTRRAVFTAQEAQMPDALYRWEWQSARIFKEQGDSEAAIAAYRRALQTLQLIRSDLSAGYGNTSTRLTFRESEGPLFYELADLLLLRAKATADPNKEQELLLEARDTVESLKTVELQDYFCDECADIERMKKRGVEAVDKHSAVIYLIPLADRTELLVGLSSGLKHFTVPVGVADLTVQVRDFRRNLETRTTYAYLAQAQQLYDWLIRPVRGLLNENHINTLVFVPDGALRTIPFAALHDGERFLIQDLAVAVAPGLSLVEPKAIERGNARLLLNGVSKAVQGFAPLDFVTNELDSIRQTYTGETLLDEQFTMSELQHKLRDEQFSVVHIASHGQFNSDVRKTFVLTYDNKLNLDELEALIRPSQFRGRPVEMLVLSACQTAAGDDRAALGLAGVAIKAGARSALASLWFVNDQSTSAVIKEFYSQLRQSSSISKARALQAAQIKLLNDRRYRHPCYWSPYLIIGNWL